MVINSSNNKEPTVTSLDSHDPTLSSRPGSAVFLPEGAVQWRATEGQVVNIGTFLLCGLGFLALLALLVLVTLAQGSADRLAVRGLGFWIMLPLLYAGLCAWRTASHRYTLTDQRLQERSGILSVTTETLELYRVKDISVHQPLLHRIFGRGRVRLATSDRSSPVVVLNAVPDPRGVADLLRACVERCRVAKGVREIDA
jgi:membrane protein YdbS with pleckstrin-like domain